MKAGSINTTYRRPDGAMQPSAGARLNKKGELVWTFAQKAPWHFKMFPNRYDGDFSCQWMFMMLLEKGHDAPGVL